MAIIRGTLSCCLRSVAELYIRHIWDQRQDPGLLGKSALADARFLGYSPSPRLSKLPSPVHAGCYDCLCLRDAPTHRLATASGAQST